MGDVYTWEAKYKDGTLIQEWEGATYGEVDRNRLDKFIVYHVDDKTKPVVTITLEPGQHIIWRKRRLDTTEGVRICTTYIAGWTNGENSHATFIVHSELFDVTIAKYESDNVNVKMSSVHGDLYDK